MVALNNFSNESFLKALTALEMVKLPNNSRIVLSVKTLGNVGGILLFSFCVIKNKNDNVRNNNELISMPKNSIVLYGCILSILETLIDLSLESVLFVDIKKSL